MTGGYVAIASIFIYFLILRSLDLRWMNPARAALLFVGLSLLVAIPVAMLENVSRGHDVLYNIFTLERFLVAFFQLIVAVFIFDRVEQAGDEYLSFAFWGGLGLALIFFIIPDLTASLLRLLG